MNGGHEADKNGLLIESLTPWAKGRAVKELPADEVEDGVAEMRAKASQVCLEIARGDRPQPNDPKFYIKRVMLHALADFQRQRQKEPRRLRSSASQPYERSLGDVGKDDSGVPVAPGWLGLQSPVKYDLVSQEDKRPHFLAYFARFVHQKHLPPRLHETYQKWMEQVDAIPNLGVRAIAMLYFQNHQKADIARSLSVSPAYVTKALQGCWAAWDLDEDAQEQVRHAWLYVELKKAIKKGRKAAGTNKRPLTWRDGHEPAPPHVRELCLREEREVFKAIKNHSPLGAWTDRLAQDDIRPIICALDPSDKWFYEPDFEHPEWFDEDDWLQPPVRPMA